MAAEKRKFMKMPKRPKDFSHPIEETGTDLERAFRELDEATDRAAGVLAAELLSAALEELLKKDIQLRHSPRQRLDEDALFGNMKPLSSFAAKIDIGYAFNLLTEDEWWDLHAIRHIRNAFAHHTTPLSFSNKGIADLCNALRLGQSQSKAESLDYKSAIDIEFMNHLWRSQFMLSVSALGLRISEKGLSLLQDRLHNWGEDK